MRNSFKNKNNFLIVEPLKTQRISEHDDSAKIEFTIDTQGTPTDDFDPNNDLIIVESFEKEQQSLLYKKPYEYMAFEGLEVNENANNFSIISAGLMQIMCDMLNTATTTATTSQTNDLLQSEYLKPAIFIMLAMDKNEKKRLYSYKLFLILIDRNVNISSTKEKEYLIYAMCNQLYQFTQNDEKFFEYTISIILNQIFIFNNNLSNLEIDYQYLKQYITNVVSRISYINLLISLLYTARKNLKLLHKCLQFLILLLDFSEISNKIDYFLHRSAILQVLLNLLHYFTVEYVTVNNKSDEIEEAVEVENGIISSNTVINDLKELFCLIMRASFRLPDSIDIVQKIENYSYFFNIFINYTYDSANIGKFYC